MPAQLLISGVDPPDTGQAVNHIAFCKSHIVSLRILHDISLNDRLSCFKENFYINLVAQIGDLKIKFSTGLDYIDIAIQDKL